jgi:hypothetical protein
MRRGLRLKTGGPIVAAPKPRPSRTDTAAWNVWQRNAAVAFAAEVANQGRNWIINGGWTQSREFEDYTEQDFERIVHRPTCYWTPLLSGDYMYLKTYQGPVSGHVALVIRERPLLDPAAWKDVPPGTPLSELVIVSGNAKDRAVRQEVVIRERSQYSILAAGKGPQRVEFDYLGTSQVGNDYDAAKTKRAKAIAAAAAPYVAARDAAVAKLAAWAPSNLPNWIPNPYTGKPKRGETPQMLAPHTLPDRAKDAPEKLYPHFASAPAWAEYVAAAAAIQAAGGPAQATFDAEVAALQARAKAKFSGMPVTRTDTGWDAANTVAAPTGSPVTGRWAPAVSSHVWVVAILRGSHFAKLDDQIANARAGGATATAAAAAIAAASNDVERMPGSIEELYGDALQYWSTSSVPLASP